MNIPDSTKRWLLESPLGCIRYNAALLFAPEKADRNDLLSDEFVRENMSLLADWNAEILRRHSQPELLIHRLSLLSDLGVRADDPGMEELVRIILDSIADDGIPRLTIEIPKAFGGSGGAEKAWIICDFPVVVSGLLGLGVRDERVEHAVKALEARVDDGGCLCKGSIPGFRGPGSKSSICPYANLLIARALAKHETAGSGTAARTALEAVLRHWDERGTKKYFMFGIGTDFQKLKFPLVWYNLLHTLDTASRFPAYLGDSRVLEMRDLLAAKADGELRFTPESMYKIFAGRDFADKKAPSPTVTLFALRVLARFENPPPA